MKKNKKMNKITSGALVIMLASGGLFSNSHASEETLVNNSAIVEKEKTNKKIENKKIKDESDVNKKETPKEEKNIEDIAQSSDKSSSGKESNEKNPNKTINDIVENEDKNKETTEKENEEQESNDDFVNKETVETAKDNIDSVNAVESNDNVVTNVENNSANADVAPLNDENNNKDITTKPKENNDEKEDTNIENNQQNVQENKKTVYINDYNSKDEFVKMLASHKDLAKEHNIFPSVMMGQAILESGYGQSGLVKNSKNIFGVKGKGDLYNTKEEINGKLIDVKDEFKRFNTYEESIRQYLDLLNNSHYSKFGVNKATNYKEQIQRIKDAGYATASNYVDAVLGVINYNNLTQYDTDDSNIQKANDSKSIIEQSKKEDIKKDNKSNNVTPSIVNGEETKTNEIKDNNSKIDSVITEKNEDSNSKAEERKNQAIDKIEKDNNLKEKENKTEETKSNIDNNLGNKQSNIKDDKNIQVKDITKDKKEQKASKDFIENIALTKTPAKDVTNIKTINKNYSQVDSSANVKTGVGSLSTTLLTLSSATAGLFINKKRK